MYQGWRDEVKELVALISKPHFKVKKLPSCHVIKTTKNNNKWGQKHNLFFSHFISGV